MPQPDKLFLVNLIRIAAVNAYKASLVAGPAFTTNLFNELNSPKPGDLVMEITTYRRPNRNPLEGIGRLLSITEVPYFKSREEAAAAGYNEDEPIPSRTVWELKMEFDDGQTTTWENASFIKIKEEFA